MERPGWEYLFLTTDLASGERLLTRWVNGDEVANWKQGKPAFQTTMDLGAQGWELITVEAFGTRHSTMIFKRPI